MLVIQTDTFALAKLFEAQLALLLLFGDFGTCSINLGLGLFEGLVRDGLVLLTLCILFDDVHFLLNESLLLLEFLSVLVAKPFKLLNLR